MVTVGCISVSTVWLEDLLCVNIRLYDNGVQNYMITYAYNMPSVKGFTGSYARDRERDTGLQIYFHRWSDMG